MRSKTHSPMVENDGLVAGHPVSITRFTFGFARRSASQRPRPRSGFTLVEMLVVITIIGILVALLIPTISSVMSATRNGTVAMEVQELSRAIEAYKNKVGDYPPDFTNRLAVANHMLKAYPRNTRKINAPPASAWLNTNLNANPIPPRTPSMLDPAEALVFWLSETRKNVRDPLGGTGDAEVYFQFDKTRLGDIDADGWQEFYPPYGSDAPYVYFDGREISVPNLTPPPPGNVSTYSYAWAIYPSPYGNTTATQAPNVPTRTAAGIPVLASTPVIGVVRPYRSNINVQNTDLKTWQATATATEWMSPGKFQIICAGLDSHFGSPEPSSFFKTYPEMNYYSDPTLDRTADESNITNFSEMKTLGDAVP